MYIIAIVWKDKKTRLKDCFFELFRCGNRFNAEVIAINFLKQFRKDPEPHFSIPDNWTVAYWKIK